MECEAAKPINVVEGAPTVVTRSALVTRLVDEAQGLNLCGCLKIPSSLYTIIIFLIFSMPFIWAFIYMYSRTQPPEKIFFDGCNYTFSTVAEGKKWYAEDDAYRKANPVHPQAVPIAECVTCAGGVTYVSSSSTLGVPWGKASSIATFALNLCCAAVVCFLYGDACYRQSCAASFLKFGVYVRFVLKWPVIVSMVLLCLLFVVLTWTQTQVLARRLDGFE